MELVLKGKSGVGVLLDRHKYAEKGAPALREVRRNARLKERTRLLSLFLLLRSPFSSRFVSLSFFSAVNHKVSFSLSLSLAVVNLFYWLILNDLGGFDCSDENETFLPCSVASKSSVF